MKYSCCFFPPGVSSLSGSGGSDARAHLRAGAVEGRDDGPRPGLRLGFPLPLDRGEIPRMPDPLGVQFENATGPHPRAVRRAGVAEPGGRHRGRQRIRAGAHLRSRRLRRDVRAHAELPAADAQDRLLAGPRGEAVRPHLRPPDAGLPFPGRNGGRLDGADLLHRAASCRRTTSSCTSRKTCLYESHWRLSGLHYRETLERWLRNLDDRKEEILPVLAEAYGEGEPDRWFHRWRLFFLACSEVWGFRGGGEWIVSHYLFRRREDG